MKDNILYPFQLRTIVLEKQIPLQEVDISKLDSLQGVFEGVEEIYGDISNWDVSHICSLRETFQGCKIPYLDLSKWDISKVKNMSNTFANTTIKGWKLFSIDSSCSLQTLEGCFYNTKIIDSDLSKWRLPKTLTTLDSMFFLAHYEGTLFPIGKEHRASMNRMCSFSTGIQGGFKNWDVRNIESMIRFFEGSDFNGPLFSLHKKCKVKNLSYFFAESKYNKPLDHWDLSKVENFRYMFYKSKFNSKLFQIGKNKIPKNFAYMWAYSKFNSPANHLNTSTVTDMQGLFLGSEFNKSISKWNVQNVKDMSEMFKQNKKFQQKIFTVRKKAKLHSAIAMFSESVFDGDISSWDVSSVRRMDYMFFKSAYNGPMFPLCNDSELRSMTYMFSESKFSGSLSHWSIPEGVRYDGIFKFGKFDRLVTDEVRQYPEGYDEALDGDYSNFVENDI